MDQELWFEERDLVIPVNWPRCFPTSPPQGQDPERGSKWRAGLRPVRCGGSSEGSANDMKMSKGRLGTCLTGLTVAAMSLLSGGGAFAEMGQPAPWEYRLQEAASPVMENITWFHGLLLTIITVITLFVLALLIAVVVKFNARANPTPSRTTHNTLLEVAWTLIPVLILVTIAVPSFRLLFLELDVPKADLTITATGKQWCWSYAYPAAGK